MSKTSKDKEDSDAKIVML